MDRHEEVIKKIARSPGVELGDNECPPIGSTERRIHHLIFNVRSTVVEVPHTDQRHLFSPNHISTSQ